ncbi:MAG TPA: DNA polymerase III subunit alpha [Stellaceae bacterium]|nr:DNA polymerase III subunit alpha [Stellaceae bacterium]
MVGWWSAAEPGSTAAKTASTNPGRIAAVANADFIHLRVHSAYSLSAGAIKLKDLPKLCKRSNMPAVAVTDTGNLFGALEYSLACSAEGIQPIIGCELGIRRVERDQRNGTAAPPEPVVLLVQNAAGYQNLLKLVSMSYMETSGGEPPQVSLADLEGLSGGLLLLTGGPAGPAGRLLAEGQRDAAEALLRRLAEAFPGRLYIELLRHGMPEEERIEPALVDLAYELDLPLVATNNCFFGDPEFYEAHDALLCIADGTTVQTDRRRRLTPDHHFKSPAAMRALFADLPEACDNTLVIARRCAFMVKKRKPILPPFPAESGRREPEELALMAHAGLDDRLAKQVFKPDWDQALRDETEKRYRDRLVYELGVIDAMGYPGYFLIVADFIQWAKRQDIPVGPGRGSGASSLVAWSLTITDVDPIALTLIFERFLNPERISMPDFDIDFCQDRREEVIDYVQGKYGRDRVAQIITFGKLQARAVLRDVGRVLEMPYGQIDRICKLVPNNPAKPVTLQQAIDSDETLQQMRDQDEGVGRLITIALKLEGLYRHASTHAAGVVIGDRPLNELVPLYRDPRSEMPVTQFNMKYVEDAGLVKFDFLGLKTLTVLQRAVELIRARGTPIELTTLPLDDGKTFAALTRGDTVGVFQFEGAGMRDLLKKLKPTQFEDLIAVVSLYRPGPMDSIPDYIARKHGLEAPDYLHPTIEHILKETYGIMTYQEQVLQIAQVMGGYSLGAADLLRRAMGKKIKSEMDNERAKFVAGSTERGVSKALADHIFDLMAKFAGYGFNKGHAAPYALLSYQTAYLKANHPVEFLAASMTLDLGNTDKLNVFRQELQRVGIKLLPPDINRSGVDFTVEDTPDGSAIRYALAAIKGVGAEAMRSVIAERDAQGRFADLFDLAQRVDAKSFNKRQYEGLAKAGAFDGLNPNRAQSVAAGDLVLRHAAAAAAERNSQQVSLFGGDAGTLPQPALPAHADWAPVDRLQQEFEAIGFYLSAHPLDPYQAALKRLGAVPFAQLQARVGHGGPTRFKLAGIVVGRKERTSAKGSRFAFVQMSDLTGMFEVTLFSEILNQSRGLLDSGVPVVVTVDIRPEDESLRLTALAIDSLDDLASLNAPGFKVFFETEAALPSLLSVLGRDQAPTNGRGGAMRLVVADDDREIEIALPGTYRIGAQMRAAMKAIPGVVEVHDL